jgi:hypothetical protein
MQQEPRFLPMEIQLDMDPEIRYVVNKLNDMGYYTEESCAGHPQIIIDETGRVWNNPGHGYIILEDLPSKKEAAVIREVLENHGFKNVRIRTGSRKFPTISFTPTGEGHRTDERIKNWKKRTSTF